MNIRLQIVLVGLAVFSPLVFSETDAERYFPDIPGYRTLVCDFHTHTVFSDGQVWPTVRIDEAARENLDALALTDHIEYQPHKDDIPTHHNRPYEIASEPAQKKDVLLIKGAEITRDTPPGHYNAIFALDIDLIDTPEFLDEIKAANEQNCFVFWNHHTWQGEEKGQWEAVQTVMFENKWLHGMEVANGDTYYPKAHQWCLEKNLTMLGNSDIHAPSGFYPYTADHHRTVTLVFAKERSVESIRQALFAGRTAVWFNNQLIGQKEYLEPLFNAGVTFSVIPLDRDGVFIVKFTNSALIDIELQRGDMPEFGQITIPARSSASTFIQSDPGDGPLVYQVRNFLIAPDTTLSVRIPLPVSRGVLIAD